MAATRRLAAILAADVAGYSRLMGADEEGTLERLKALRRELVDPKIIRALAYVGQSTRAGWEEAEALCRRAIAIAPDYGQAHSLLAWVILRRTALSQLDAVLPEARAEARTALRLDEHDPWAHIVRG